MPLSPIPPAGRGKRPQAAWIPGLLATLLAGLLALARWFPWELTPPLCALKSWTGIPCPGCGTTRAWAALAHGQLSQGFAWNPLGALLFLLAAAAIPVLAFHSLGWLPSPPRPPPRSQLLRRHLTVGVVAVLALAVAGNWIWIIRNLH